MATTRKTITLSEQQDAWVKSRIESSDFTNDSEHFRDLIRRDQNQNGKFLALKRAIQDGLDSGVSNRTVAGIWQEAEQRQSAKNG